VLRMFPPLAVISPLAPIVVANMLLRVVAPMAVEFRPVEVKEPMVEPAIEKEWLVPAM